MCRSVVECAIKPNEEINYCNLRKREVRTIAAASKRCPNRAKIANPKLEYVSMTYTCKFSGYPEKHEQRKRKVKSFRQGCSFEVCFGLSEDGQSLNIKKLNEVYSHLVFEELYKHMPCQRLVPDDIKENVQQAISLISKNKLLQQKIWNSGINVTLKDIANMKQYRKSDLKKNDIESIVNFFKTKERTSAVEVCVLELVYLGLIFYKHLMELL